MEVILYVYVYITLLNFIFRKIIVNVIVGSQIVAHT